MITTDRHAAVTPLPGTRSQTVFESAIRYNYFDLCNNLENPFSDIKIPGSTYKRKRTLREGELEKLEDACKECLGENKLYLPLAIHLAVETGMRASEIFNLLWSDVDLDKRRIKIKKSKTDRKQEEAGGGKGRFIVLPYMSKLLLRNLRAYLIDNGTYSENDRIFLPTGHAILQSFRDVVRRAKIQPHNGEQLIFKDLRRTANIGFIRARLDDRQREIMMGHGDMNINISTYTDDEKEYWLEPIQDELDKYHIGGTEKELEDKGIIMSVDTVTEIGELVGTANDPPGISFRKLDAKISGRKLKGHRQWQPDRRQSEEGIAKLLDQEVLVYRFDKDHGVLSDPLGWLSIREAAKLLDISPVDLSLKYINERGGLIRNNYAALTQEAFERLFDKAQASA